MKEVIKTDKAPAAVGPYSQAIKFGNTLYTAGQVPIDPATGKVADCDLSSQIDPATGKVSECSISTQAKQCLKNLEGVITSAGFAMTDVVKVTVFITDMADFPLVNEEYKKFFQEPYPARSCVGVASLPLGVRVEMEAIAVKN